MCIRDRAMTADFRKVEADTKRYAQMLTEASMARIEKDGHVLTLNLKGRNGVPSTGVYRNPGEAGNLPSGEAYIAPLEDGVNGSMVIDGSMEAMGILEEPLTVTIEKEMCIRDSSRPREPMTPSGCARPSQGASMMGSPESAAGINGSNEEEAPSSQEINPAIGVSDCVPSSSRILGYTSSE